jgi:hypothetical protein
MYTAGAFRRRWVVLSRSCRRGEVCILLTARKTYFFRYFFESLVLFLVIST